MSKWVLVIFITAFYVACKNDNNVPGGILPPKQMQAVLWDLMRADQFVIRYILPKDSTFIKSLESIKLYQQVFNLHEISKEKFEKSFSYYQRHPDLLKVIMDSLQKPPIAIVPKKIDTDSTVVAPVLEKIGEDSVIIDTSSKKADTGNKLKKFPLRKPLPTRVD